MQSNGKAAKSAAESMQCIHFAQSGEQSVTAVNVNAAVWIVTMMAKSLLGSDVINQNHQSNHWSLWSLLNLVSGRKMTS